MSLRDRTQKITWPHIWKIRQRSKWAAVEGRVDEDAEGAELEAEEEQIGGIAKQDAWQFDGQGWP